MSAMRKTKTDNVDARQIYGNPDMKPNSLGKNPGDVVFTKHEIAVGRTGNVSYNDPLHKKAYHESGKNPGDFWSITTQPFPAAHFATFPEELCLKPLKSSVPKQICCKCGFIRERITEPTEEYKKRLGKTWHNHEKDIERGQRYSREIAGAPCTASYKTIGWTKCKCDDKFIPGVVLDPFAGSGTTLKVAKDLKLNYIGFELSKEYIDIALMRLKGAANWQFKEVENNKTMEDFA